MAKLSDFTNEKLKKKNYLFLVSTGPFIAHMKKNTELQLVTKSLSPESNDKSHHRGEFKCLPQTRLSLGKMKAAHLTGTTSHPD